MAGLREQAGVERAFGRKPHAGAVPAEGPGHRGDHADLARAVAVAPAFGDLARVVRIDRLERKLLADLPDHLRRGNHVVHAPAVGAAHVHVLDEAHDVTAPPPMACHVGDLVIVHSALDHHVDLDRRKAGSSRGVDSLQHLCHREVGVVHLAERRVVERIEAHGDAVEPRALQLDRLARESRTIGGEREIRTERRKQRNQLRQVLAHQRLAAREPDLFHAQTDEDARHARNFLEREDRAVRQERVARVEHFARHAVHAAEIAPVGDRDAQVARLPAERILRGRAIPGGRGEIAALGANRNNLLWHGAFLHEIIAEGIVA